MAEVSWCPWQRNLYGISFLLRNNSVSFQVHSHTCIFSGNHILNQYMWIRSLVYVEYQQINISVNFLSRTCKSWLFWLWVMQLDLSPIKAIPRHFECYFSSFVTQENKTEKKSDGLIPLLSFFLITCKFLLSIKISHTL